MNEYIIRLEGQYGNQCRRILASNLENAKGVAECIAGVLGRAHGDIYTVISVQEVKK